MAFIKNMGSIILLEEKHKQSICEYFAISPVENLRLISIINYMDFSQNKNHFYAYQENGEWQGAINFDWDISIVGANKKAIKALAKLALERKPFVPRVTGKNTTIDIFWETFKTCNKKLLFNRKLIGQILEKNDFDFNGEYLYIQQAEIGQLEEITKMAAAMNLEETGIYHLIDESYMDLIKQRIENNNYYVLKEDGIIKFIIMVSYISPYAVQIDEAYVLPEFRRNNYATRCIGDLCKFILEHIAPRVCGISHENNIAPISYLKKLGFKPVLELKSIFLEDKSTEAYY